MIENTASTSTTFLALNEVPIFHTHDSKDSNEYKIAYLDFVELNEEHDGRMDTATFGRSPGFEQEPIKSLGLKLKVANGPFDSMQLKPDDVDSLDVYEALVDVGTNMVIERAYKNSQRESKNQAKNYFNIDLEKPEFYFRDEKKKVELQYQNLGRKMLSKLLGISNIIATNGRRGSGTYVILSEYIYDILDGAFVRKYKGLYSKNEGFANLAGLNILCSDKLKDNQFIVGRKPKPEEPGLHLITSDSKISNYFLNKPDDMILKVDFKLLFVGDEEKDNTVFGGEINWINGKI